MQQARPSYPFFALAMQTGFDYGLILNFADAYTKRFTKLTIWERQARDVCQNTPLGRAIIALVNAERFWNSGQHQQWKITPDGATRVNDHAGLVTPSRRDALIAEFWPYINAGGAITQAQVDEMNGILTENSEEPWDAREEASHANDAAASAEAHGMTEEQ